MKVEIDAQSELLVRRASKRDQDWPESSRFGRKMFGTNWGKERKKEEGNGNGGSAARVLLRTLNFRDG